MCRVQVRCYAELNDCLPREQQFKTFFDSVDECRPVSEVLEQLGIPPAMVDLLLVNGESVDLSHPLHEGDRVSVYPVFETFDIAPLARIRSRPLRKPRFVLDTHLGRLAFHLRMMGFDALYRNDYDDDTLAEISIREGRLLLSRDRRLLERQEIVRGYRVRETNPHRQLIEILRRLDLFRLTAPFTRCLRCNSVLQFVDKLAILHRLPARVMASYDDFRICPGCGKLYWQGTHVQRMKVFIEEALLERNNII